MKLLQKMSQLQACDEIAIQTSLYLFESLLNLFG